MGLLSFFLSYFMLLIASGVFIVAWWLVTRGQIEVQPDGSEKKGGNVFKSWWFFWNKETKEIPDYNRLTFRGQQFSLILSEIRKEFKDALMEASDYEGITKGHNYTFRASMSIIATIPVLENKFDIKFYLVKDEGSGFGLFKILKNEKTYHWHEGIRKVMANCITCAPTFYGNIIYWIMILTCKHTVLYWNLFSIFEHPYLGVFVVWIAYWLSLSYFTTYLWNKLHK